MTQRKPGPRDQEIGRRIRARRKVLGMTQTVLGEKLGVSFQQIQKYEKGTNGVRSGRLADLARVLRVPITFFYNETNSQEGDVSAVLELANTVQAFSLLKAFLSVEDTKTRQAIVDLVLQLASRGKEVSKALSASEKD